jgi:hypothetical protein
MADGEPILPRIFRQQARLLSKVLGDSNSGPHCHRTVNLNRTKYMMNNTEWITGLVLASVSSSISEQGILSWVWLVEIVLTGYGLEPLSDLSEPVTLPESMNLGLYHPIPRAETLCSGCVQYLKHWWRVFDTWFQLPKAQRLSSVCSLYVFFLLVHGHCQKLMEIRFSLVGFIMQTTQDSFLTNGCCRLSL